MNSPKPSIRKKCYGRDDLQDKLRKKYDLAANGEPQMAILLGSTGMGKTRLAQELYRWLTIERDHQSDEFPEGYWPDAFIDEQRKDKVNPDPDDRPRPEIPFLWWGLKFTEQAQPGEAIDQTHRELALHSFRVAQRRSIQAKDAEAWYQLFGVGITLAGLFPGVAAFANWLALGKESFDQTKRMVSRTPIHTDETVSNRELSDRLAAEKVNQVVNVLGMFLDEKFRPPPRFQ